VVAFSVDEDVLVDGHPEFDRLRPVSKLARDEWGLAPEVVRRARPGS
jgi:hypothetical protein